MKTVVGYNIKFGSHGYGAFCGYPEEKLIEMPVDEAFMTGYALGRAMAGDDVLLYFERMNFIYEAMSELVNHAAVIARLWGNVKFLVCAVVQYEQDGFYVGCQHVVKWWQQDKLCFLLDISFKVFERKDVRKITDLALHG